METMGLNHIVMTVSNAERSRQFYGDLLGFKTKVMAEGPNGGFNFVAGKD
jgi:catechol 2,3-dioxygenase-like lactoylglutathione lyase family enzyme